MKYKLYLISRFFPVAISNFRLLLKNLFRFTEEQNSRRRVKKLNYTEGLPTINLLDLFPDFNETIANYTYLDDTSPVTDIALLKAFAKSLTPCDYLEIGSWRGESILNVSEYAQSCISLSLSDEDMAQKKFSKRQIEMNRYFIKNNPRITHIGHDSQTFDFSSLEKKFDLIFVDGDHHYNAVLNDTKNVFKLLKNENSVIVWHDYQNSYERIRWEVFDAILEGTPPEKRKFLYSVSNTYCAVYIGKPLPAKYLSFPQTPDKLFLVNLKAKMI
ncbi:MAG: class I SAM-dependent methyltransferase [Bacteroidia bacterium]|nr:class I SAM-dependent methyltransferase [Bacteroidia bacterium]